jgi:predicted PurR-regulated permease PerM
MVSPPKEAAPRPEDVRRRVVRFDLAPATLISIVLVVAGVWALVRLLPVILVLVAALIIVGTVNPAVQWLEARRVRRGAGIAIVFTALTVLTLIVITLTVPALLAQVTDLLEQEPTLRARLADFLDGFRLTAPFAEPLRDIHYDTLAKSAAATALSFSARILEVFAYSVSAVFLALYLMIDRDRLRGWLFAVVPRKRHIRLSRVMMNLETIVGGYMRGQVITSLLIAVFLFVLLKAFSVPNALAVAVFGGIADVLPYIGAFLTIGPAVLAALARGPAVAVSILVLILVYEEFESRVLVPRIYGRALRLPSAVVLFALLAGGTLQGIVGALLSIPVAAAALMLVEELRVRLPGEPEKMGWSELHERDARSEEEYKRRAEGLPADQAAALAIEISRAHRHHKKKKVAPPVQEGHDRSGKPE